MKKYALLIVVILTAVAAVYAYFQFLKPLDVFMWDESHHGLYGMWIYDDLRMGNWGLFWQHTNHQSLWMPLHSWLNAVFMLVFGFSYTSTRLSSLFIFFISSILLFLIGLEMSKENGWIIGLISACLFLTSPILLSLATLNMQEMPGILICLIVAYSIIRNISFEKRWKYAAIGFLLSVAYWTKQNYAIVIGSGVFFYQISLLWDIRNAPPEVRTEEPRNRTKKQKNAADNPFLAALKQNGYLSWCVDNLLILAGFLPLIVLWWASPPFQRKFAQTFTFREQNSFSGEGGSLVSNIIGTAAYYIQCVISSYNLSFWLGLGCVAALLASLIMFREKKTRILSLLFVANMIFISLISFAQERYISTAQPLLFVLFAYFLVMIVDRLKADRKSAIAGFTVLALLGASFAYDLTRLTAYTKEVGNRSLQYPIYKDSLNRFSPPFLFGLAKRPAFTIPKDQSKKYPDFKETPRSTIGNILDFFSVNMEKGRPVSTMINYQELSPYEIYWHFHDWGGYVFTVNDLAIPERPFWSSDYFLDLKASPDSPYYVDCLERRWDDVSGMLLKRGIIKLVARKEFSDLGLTASVYQRKKTFRVD